MLLDTTFFIDLSREVRAGQPGPAAAFLRLHHRADYAVSVVTLGEFAIGMDAPATRRFFWGFRPVALGRELAIFAGRLQSRLNFTLGENDLWIAATALYHQWPLATRDLAFAKIPSLKVMAY